MERAFETSQFDQSAYSVEHSQIPLELPEAFAQRTGFYIENDRENTRLGNLSPETALLQVYTFAEERTGAARSSRVYRKINGFWYFPGYETSILELCHRGKSVEGNKFQSRTEAEYQVQLWIELNVQDADSYITISPTTNGYSDRVVTMVDIGKRIGDELFITQLTITASGQEESLNQAQMIGSLIGRKDLMTEDDPAEFIRKSPTKITSVNTESLELEELIDRIDFALLTNNAEPRLSSATIPRTRRFIHNDMHVKVREIIEGLGWDQSYVESLSPSVPIEETQKELYKLLNLYEELLSAFSRDEHDVQRIISDAVMNPELFIRNPAAIDMNEEGGGSVNDLAPLPAFERKTRVLEDLEEARKGDNKTQEVNTGKTELSSLGLVDKTVSLEDFALYFLSPSETLKPPTIPFTATFTVIAPPFSSIHFPRSQKISITEFFSQALLPTKVSTAALPFTVMPVRESLALQRKQVPEQRQATAQIQNHEYAVPRKKHPLPEPPKSQKLQLPQSYSTNQGNDNLANPYRTHQSASSAVQEVNEAVTKNSRAITEQVNGESSYDARSALRSHVSNNTYKMGNTQTAQSVRTERSLTERTSRTKNVAIRQKHFPQSAKKHTRKEFFAEKYRAFGLQEPAIVRAEFRQQEPLLAQKPERKEKITAQTFSSRTRAAIGHAEPLCMKPTVFFGAFRSKSNARALHAQAKTPQLVEEILLKLGLQQSQIINLNLHQDAVVVESSRTLPELQQLLATYEIEVEAVQQGAGNFILRKAGKQSR